MANNAYLSCYKRNKELVVSKAKEYYKSNKERLNKQEREKYNNLPEYRENTEEINTVQCLKKKKTKEINMKEIDIAA